MDVEKNLDLSFLVIHMMKGILYRDSHEQHWQSLQKLRGPLEEYISVMGLICIVDENEGYAYFKQSNLNDDESFPRLFQRRPLGYNASLLCILLRKKLVESDAGGDSTRIILTFEQIVEMMLIYMPDTNNDAKTVEQIKTTINRIVELGFLRTLDLEKNKFEIRRILRAFIDADFISSFEEKIEQYRKTNSN